MVALALTVGLTGPAAAQTGAQTAGQTGGQTWTERKCRLYTSAWVHATAGAGLDGIGPAFIAAHDAFIASGCTAPARVCPTNAAEHGLADLLSLMAVAEGMAGSFLPFACRD